MRFYVDTNERKSMQIVVQEEGKTVNIVGQDINGHRWTIFTLLPDGTFEKGGGIPNDIGLQVSKSGKIVEVVDKKGQAFIQFAKSVKQVGFNVSFDPKQKMDMSDLSADAVGKQILRIEEGGREEEVHDE